MTNLVLNEAAEALSPAWLSLIQNCIETTLKAEEFPFDAEVSFSIVEDEEIRALNASERGIDQVTDVLSFPMLSLEDGVLIVEDEDVLEGCVFLGDIVISLLKMKAQAAEYGHSEERELGFLTVHSMLHLLGYDHEEGSREESEMFRKQEEILQSIGLTR